MVKGKLVLLYINVNKTSQLKFWVNLLLSQIYTINNLYYYIFSIYVIENKYKCSRSFNNYNIYIYL